MKDKIALSIPKSKKVCGYEIKKMPIGKYLSAMDRLKNLPKDFLEKTFPSKNLKEILDGLSNVDEEMLGHLIFNGLTIFPEYAIEIVAELTDIDKDEILNNENIGIDGLIEIIKAFEEVNQLGKSMADAKILFQKLGESVPKLTARIGSRG